MAWLFDPSAWTVGYSPTVTDYQNIAADLRAAGGNRDSAGYGQPNTAWTVLIPGELPGDSYSITGASWTTGVATLVIGPHFFRAGQHFSSTGNTPTGYNGPDIVITSVVVGTSISFALASNPGTWVSGGTVIASATAAANGMLAVDAAGNLSIYLSGSWGSTLRPPLTILLAPNAIGVQIITPPIAAPGVQMGGFLELAANSFDTVDHIRAFSFQPATTSNPGNGTLSLITTLDGAGANSILSIDQAGNLAIDGAMTSYDGVTAVNQGMGVVVASALAATNVGANQSGTVYAVPAGQAGWYRITISCSLTRPATTTSTLPTTSISFNQPDNGGGVFTQQIGNTGGSGNTGATQSLGTSLCHCAASTNITFSQASYASNPSSGVGQMEFTLRFIVEYLGA